MATDIQLDEFTNDSDRLNPTFEATGRRRWPIAVVVTAVIAIAGGWYVTRGGGTEVEDIPVSLEYAEVVRTDLVEETAYDGTLGRIEGESITAAAQGTITELAAPGAVIGQGESLYQIDGQPTVLLIGDVPLYRELRASEDDIAVTARRPGIVTWLPAEGTPIEEGDVLYEVDGEPVVALYGSTPSYRTLSDQRANLEGVDVLQLEESLEALGFVSPGEMTVDGEFTSATESVVEQFQEAVGATEDGVVDLGEVVFIEGPAEISTIDAAVGDAVSDGRAVLTLVGGAAMTGDDVLQLESALAALGYEPGDLDGVFTADTTQAVRAFEEAVGLDGDGRIEIGEVVFVPAPVRIAERLVSVGAGVNGGAPLLAVTGEDTVVTMELPAADQDSLEEGMAVTVELPDGTDASATVTSVAAVASVSANNTTVFDVEIQLDDPSVAQGLDEAPVDVLVVTDSVEDVMAVPVASLLALAEGGYAVEVDAGGGATRLVAVDPGFFADGLVEVTGEGLEAGDRVVIP